LKNTGVEFNTFEGNGGGWYWRCGPASGGRKTGDGSEGYSSRSAAKRAAKSMIIRIRSGPATVDGVLVAT